MTSKILLFLSVILLGNFINAQNSNMVVFNQEGDKFRIVLNGTLQHSDYETNVKITGLNRDAFKVNILFEDTIYPNLETIVYFIANGVENTYRIQKNNAGNYILSATSIIPISPNSASKEQVMVVYSATSPTANPTDEIMISDNSNDSILIAIALNNDEDTTASQHYVMEGYKDSIGCPFPMDMGDFNTAKNVISSTTFADTKLSMAKQVTSSNCLTAEQVKEITLLFNYEDTKLEFAKFAYQYTFDIGNYLKVNDAFDFENTAEELNQYIDSVR